MKISATVGHGGINRPEDVRTVQRALNEHNLPPLTALDVTGVADEATISTIRHFQSVKVGLKKPDGRVDPGGQTLRKLAAAPINERSEPSGHAQSVAVKSSDTARRKFVEDSVKELPVTTRIIDTILPHFAGVQAVVVSAYLNDKELFWKVNYHWDLLLWMATDSLKLDLDESAKTKLKEIRSALLSCRPDPDSGYRTSRAGIPEDRSSAEEFNRRYLVLAHQKKQFEYLIKSTDLVKKSSRREKDIHLAAAVVAKPGVSKHSTGYALDIRGDNGGIARISKQLGATFVFDEKSHVHVEFAKFSSPP